MVSEKAKSYHRHPQSPHQVKNPEILPPRVSVQMARGQVKSGHHLCRNDRSALLEEHGLPPEVLGAQKTLSQQAAAGWAQLLWHVWGHYEAELLNGDPRW
jgi:hypothetical protein